MEISQEIHNLLEDNVYLKRSVQLITIYKNIPLAFEAESLSFHSGTAEFKVHPYQIAAAVLVKQIYIQSEGISNCILAQVVRMDPVNMILGCSDFIDAGNSLSRRTYVRVEPETSIPVFLFLGETKVRADLADISEEGISVYLDPFEFNAPEAEPQKFSARFEVRFLLPGESYSPISLQGAIRYGLKDTLSKRFRLGIQLYPDDDARRLLMKFVKRRQTSALQNIKKLYERSLTGGHKNV